MRACTDLQVPNAHVHDLEADGKRGAIRGGWQRIRGHDIDQASVQQLH